MKAQKEKTPVSQFDYHLPKELIAQEPIEPRDHARLMLVCRKTETISHHYFYELPTILSYPVVIVRNNTKVFPARLFAKKKTGGKVELLLTEEVQPHLWKALAKANRPLSPPLSLTLIPDGPTIQVVEKTDSLYLVEFPKTLPMGEILDRFGHVPLPPYIQRPDRPEDRERYQTIYAQKVGAYAAPTAGLHFTERVLKKLEEKGAIFADLTLHVGLGTFAPIKVKYLEDHKMHKEFFSIPKETVEIYEKARKEGIPILAVGTTSVRTLETYLLTGKTSGWTDLFLHPPYKIQSVQMLLTNFHLPKSTLLMLLASFADWKLIQKAYEIAVKEKYRFFSYGDCMLIV